MSAFAKKKAREAYMAGVRHLSSNQRRFAKTAFNALRREGHSMQTAVQHAVSGAAALRSGESPRHALQRLRSTAGQALERRGHKAIDRFASSTGKHLLDKGLSKTEAFLHDQINKSKQPQLVKTIGKKLFRSGVQRARKRIVAEGSKRAKSALSKLVSKVFGRGMKKGGHPYSRGPIGRADGFYSVDRRTGMTVPRRHTMHRQNIHTV